MLCVLTDMDVQQRSIRPPSSFAPTKPAWPTEVAEFEVSVPPCT